MNDKTQVFILAAVAAALAALAALQGRRHREAFVSGNVVGIQADLKRQGIEREMHAAAAGVADGAQGLGCAYLAALAGAVQAPLTGGAARVPCSRVTDHIRKLENAVEARIRAGKLSAKTKDKMSAYKRQAVDAIRAVFDPLCTRDTFDPREVSAALKAIQASYCGALPTPARDAAAAPAGTNDPRLTTAVQNAQKALTEHLKKGAGADPVKASQLQAALAASRAALLASNVRAAKPAMGARAGALATKAAQAAQAAQGAKNAGDAKRHAAAAAAATSALQALSQAAAEQTKTSGTVKK